jgi:DNA-directed RNA polymerase subunit RPC12/RpoP
MITLIQDWNRLIPLEPIWPGFAINTIFYAALLWVLWVAPGKIRRFVRVRAHRCPACGYRIAEGVGPNCSECGAQLPAELRLAFQ